MIKKITSFLNNFFFKEVSGIGLSVFRIFYHIIFFAEVATIYNYRQLYFDEIPFLKATFPDLTFLFFLWFLIIIFQVIGYKFRLFSLFNYIFGLVFISSAVSFEYHMFYAYTGINFLFLFLPANKVFSIDYLIKKKQLANQGIKYNPPMIAKINYFIPIFLGLGLVYFDSVIFYKFKSHIWMNGLGLWLPSSLPHVTISEFNWILNNEFLVKSLSYITLIFEFIFIFLFCIKIFRLPLFIIGLGLHLGILLEYPIPYFALGCLSIYFLLVPISFWEKCRNYFNYKINRNSSLQKINQAYQQFFKVQKLKIQKNSNKNNSEYWLANFQIPKNKIRNGILVFLALFLIIAQRQVHYSFFSNSKVTYKANKALMVYWGITKHPVFMDNHFKGYNNIYTLKYKDKFLPLLNEKGMPDKYISGGTWVNWSWRVNGPYVTPRSYNLQHGLKNYSAFWIRTNGLKGNRSVSFDIVRKKVKVSFEWEKDLLKNNIKSPWEKVGSLTWGGGRAKIKWIKDTVK